MNDFDYDELDRAVSNTLEDGSDRKDPAPAPATADPKPEASPPDSGVPARKTSPGPSSGPLVKPRTSINRNPQPAASKGGAVDIVAVPSKRPLRDGAVVTPTRPIDNVHSTPTSSGSDKHKTDNVAVPEREAGEDSALRWPPRSDTAEAPKPATDDTSSVPSPAEPGQAAAADKPADDGSFERFDALSRSGLDFDKSSAPKPAEPAESAPAASQPSPYDSEPTAPATEPSDTPAPPDASKEKSEDTPEDKSASSTQSPFLSDTKVEKRPLGSYSSTIPVESPADKDSRPVADSSDAKQPGHAQVNADAGADADKTDKHDAAPEAAPAKVSAEAAKPAAEPTKPAQEKALTDHLLSDGHEHEQPAAAKDETAGQASGALGSIPQQYKVAASDHKDEASHPVFDTKEYHAPVAAGKKASSHGSNVFLIVSIVLLVLAIAAAAGIYFYGEQLGLALPELERPTTSAL